MAMNEAEKLVVSLAADLGKTAYDGLNDLYQQTKEELERVKRERDEAAYYANKYFKIQELLGIKGGNDYKEKYDGY